MGPVELAIRDRDFRESIFEDLELLAIPDDFEIREKDLCGAELSVQSRIFERDSDYNEGLYR